MRSCTTSHSAKICHAKIVLQVFQIDIMNMTFISSREARKI